MSDAPVTLIDVSKNFGTKPAVQSVSWAPRRAEVTALVGLNGAGKSTLMRMMVGLIKPTAGQVSVQPQPGRRTLSAMIEAPALFTGLSVRRNLEIHRTLCGADPASVTESAELAQIEHVLGQRLGTLSQGYRQRVAIAVALLGSPAVLLLDEPTNALDPEAVVHLRTLIRQLAAQDTAVVVSTHLLRELEGTADALAVLHEGRMLYQGPFAEFVGPVSLRIRATAGEADARLEEILRQAGIRAERQAGALLARPIEQSADELARRVFATAADAGLHLVELSHVQPTLEETFHTVIAGGGE